MTNHVRVHDAVEQYLAQRQANCAPSTAMNDASVLRRFARSTGNIQVRHLRVEHVDRWFFGAGTAKLREPSSFNNYRKRLNSFMRYCAQRGWLRDDPMVNVRVRRVMRKERLRLSAEQMMDLLDLAANPRDRAYLAININTGLRASEVVALRVGDVDLDAGALHVTIVKTAEEDVMPVTLELDQELRRWLIRYEADMGRPLQPAMFLLPSSTGPRYHYDKDEQGVRVRSSTPGVWQPHKPLSNPAQVVHKALRALDLPTKGEGSHTLRRSVARLYFDMLAADGYDGALRATSALLHHKDASTTENYLGLTRERRHRDETLRGQPFLSALLAADDNVVDLPKARAERPHR